MKSPALLALLTLSVVGCSAPTATVNLDGDNHRKAGIIGARPGVRAAAVPGLLKALKTRAPDADMLVEDLGSFRAVAHRVCSGSVRARGWGPSGAKPAALTTLMDRALSGRLGADGVVADVRLLDGKAAALCPVGKPCLSVLHKHPIHLRKSAAAAARTAIAKTLWSPLLRHFLAKHSGKRLVVRLGEPPQRALDKPSALRAYARALAQGLRSSGSADEMTWSVAARSQQLLSEVRQALGASFKARWIWDAAGRLHSPGASAKRCGFAGVSAEITARSKSRDLQWLASTPWLDEVWLAPRCARDAAERLSAVNRQRQQGETPLNPLRVGLDLSREGAAQVSSSVARWRGPKLSVILLAVEED